MGSNSLTASIEYDWRAVSGRPERPAGGISGKSGSVFFCTRKNSNSGATTGCIPSPRTAQHPAQHVARRQLVRRPSLV
jgi:hypothetical protein